MVVNFGFPPGPLGPSRRACCQDLGLIFSLLKLEEKFTKKIQKKLIFSQYLEIGRSLQPNFANFNPDFLPKYR